MKELQDLINENPELKPYSSNIESSSWATQNLNITVLNLNNMSGISTKPYNLFLNMNKLMNIIVESTTSGCIIAENQSAFVVVPTILKLVYTVKRLSEEKIDEVSTAILVSMTGINRCQEFNMDEETILRHTQTLLKSHSINTNVDKIKEKLEFLVKISCIKHRRNNFYEISEKIQIQ